MNESFNENIAKICGLELAALAGSYKYSVFSGTTAVVEGHRGIAVYTDTDVSFYVGDKLLKIAGENLKIKRLCKNFAVVAGKISSIGVADR